MPLFSTMQEGPVRGNTQSVLSLPGLGPTMHTTTRSVSYFRALHHVCWWCVGAGTDKLAGGKRRPRALGGCMGQRVDFCTTEGTDVAMRSTGLPRGSDVRGNSGSCAKKEAWGRATMPSAGCEGYFCHFGNYQKRGANGTSSKRPSAELLHVIKTMERGWRCLDQCSRGHRHHWQPASISELRSSPAAFSAVSPIWGVSYTEHHHLSEFLGGGVTWGF